MKRLISICLLALLALAPLSSLAETPPAFTADDYVTLGELREQALAGWHEAYTAHGREVVANVDIHWMPETDACPIIEVAKTLFTPDDSLLEPYRGKWNYVEVGPRGVDIYIGMESKTANYVNGYTVDSRNLDDFDRVAFRHGETPDIQPEGLDMTWEEFQAFVNDRLRPITGVGLEAYYMKSIGVDGIRYRARRMDDGQLVRGEAMTRNGMWFLYGPQMFHGIPEGNPFAEGTPQGGISCMYAGSDYNYVTQSHVTEVAMLEEDVPLLSFDAMKRVLEAQIENGNLRGIDEMQLCYLPLLQKDENGQRFVLQPAWRVLGGYTADAGSDKNVLPYYDPRDTDGSMSVPMGYYDYYYNAQTGEMLQTLYMTGDSKPLPAWDTLTWADVGGNH